MINKLKKLFQRKPLNQKYVLTFTKKWIGRLMYFSILSVVATFVIVIISTFLSLEPEIVIALIDMEKKIIIM